jgi:hypothetical protein
VTAGDPWPLAQHLHDGPTATHVCWAGPGANTAMCDDVPMMKREFLEKHFPSFFFLFET